MKLTKHNGRAGKNGAFNPKHNDRSFDVSHSEHIDEERAAHNIYWDCYNGYRQLSEKNSDEIEMASTFEEVEQLYYHNRYSDYTDGQNERNAKSRHTERNRTTEEILKNKKTCPEETLLQIGKMEEHVSAETLFLIATEFFAEFEQRFGSHVHILDWALHIDERLPTSMSVMSLIVKISMASFVPNRKKLWKLSALNCQNRIKSRDGTTTEK